MGFNALSLGEKRVWIARNFVFKPGAEVDFTLGRDPRAWALYAEEFRPEVAQTTSSSVEVSIENQGEAFDLLLRKMTENKVAASTIAPKERIVIFKGPMAEFAAAMLKSSRLKPVGGNHYQEWNPLVMIRSIGNKKISAKLIVGSADGAAKEFSMSIYAYIPQDTI